MRERPILLNGDMVRAILEGRKTVTRRAISWRQTPFQEIAERDDGSPWPWREDLDRGGDCWYPCPFGVPGDRLWVREAWVADAQLDAVAPRNLSQGEPIHYSAGGSIRQTGCSMITLGKTRPPIHMPRWASRILLEVTAVRVERLQDITEEQAKADGADPIECKFPLGKDEIELPDLPLTDEANPYRNGFALLWEELGGDWDANPWVWVIEFKRVEAPHA